jgi:hypothetical protein
MRIRIQLFSSKRILILLFITVMRVCDRWYTYILQTLQCSILSILSLYASVVSHHGSIFCLLNFNFNADPDPAFHFPTASKIIQIRTQLPDKFILILEPGSGYDQKAPYFFFGGGGFNTASSAPLRFHRADGCWGRTQDRCNWCIGSQTL